MAYLRTHRQLRPPQRRRAGGAIVGLVGIVAVVVASAQPAPAARGLRLGDRVLATGSSGADVRELQRTLSRLELPTTVTGAFGSDTASNVRRYERRERLKVDGAVGRGQAHGMRRRAGTLAFGSRALRRGSRGRDVRRLQTVLSDLGLRASVDGVFGRGTERTVRRYERRERLRADGVVSRSQARRMVGRPVPVTAPAGSAPAAPGARRFPVAGAYRFAGEGGHFHDRGGRHQGEDIFAACGTPLVAVENGSVVFVGVQDRAGHYVVLRGAETGQDHVYMHMLERTPLARGAAVASGQPVGALGDTGNATACHLHFELWSPPGWFAGGAPIDPLPSLQAWAAAGTG